MADQATNIVILGSSGSIGRSALDVVRASGGRFKVVALTANKNLQLLCEQAAEFSPRWIVATDPIEAQKFDWKNLPRGTSVLKGQEGIREVVTASQTDLVLAAIVGSIGLMGTWWAVEAGKSIALANKESLVMAGQRVMSLARERGVAILPVDSEHSAIFQAMRSGSEHEVSRIVLTASGGPFRTFAREKLEFVTIQDALSHPTWAMGPKITVDSATMMNKALEVVEARWLFDLSPDQIEVVIHPQSIVHSLVEFVDGSVIAQMSPPDMRLPIQFALTYPDRVPGPAQRLDWTRAMQLEFEPPSRERFPALQLGYEVARAGGTAGAVLNAANEEAVALFLSGKIKFTQIVPLCRSVLEHHTFDSNPTLDELIQIDAWARQELPKWIH